MRRDYYLLGMPGEFTGAVGVHTARMPLAGVLNQTLWAGLAPRLATTCDDS